MPSIFCMVLKLYELIQCHVSCCYTLSCTKQALDRVILVLACPFSVGLGFWSFSTLYMILGGEIRHFKPLMCRMLNHLLLHVQHVLSSCFEALSLIWILGDATMLIGGYSKWRWVETNHWRFGHATRDIRVIDGFSVMFLVLQVEVREILIIRWRVEEWLWHNEVIW